MVLGAPPDVASLCCDDFKMVHTGGVLWGGRGQAHWAAGGLSPGGPVPPASVLSG